MCYLWSVVKRRNEGFCLSVSEFFQLFNEKNFFFCKNNICNELDRPGRKVVRLEEYIVPLINTITVGVGKEHSCGTST